MCRERCDKKTCWRGRFLPCFDFEGHMQKHRKGGWGEGIYGDLFRLIAGGKESRLCKRRRVAGGAWCSQRPVSDLTWAQMKGQRSTIGSIFTVKCVNCKKKKEEKKRCNLSPSMVVHCRLIFVWPHKTFLLWFESSSGIWVTDPTDRSGRGSSTQTWNR